MFGVGGSRREAREGKGQARYEAGCTAPRITLNSPLSRRVTLMYSIRDKACRYSVVRYYWSLSR